LLLISIKIALALEDELKDYSLVMFTFYLDWLLINVNDGGKIEDMQCYCRGQCYSILNWESSKGCYADHLNVILEIMKI